MDQPDRFTAEWWRAQYEGVCHTQNMLAREIGRYSTRFAALWKRIEEQQAEIAELRLANGKMNERLDKAWEFVKGLRAEAPAKKDGACNTKGKP